jgi:hypothetical protein
MLAGDLSIQKMHNREFESTYTPIPNYPLKRAAEKFLFRAELQSVQPQAREHLERILRTEESKLSSIQQPMKEEDDMSTQEEGASSAPAKKAAKANPAKKTPPAAKKSAKAAPAPAKKASKKEAEAPKRGRPRDDDSTYKVGDTASVKRGFLADYVAAAQKMGTFTRDKIVKKMISDEVDEAKSLRYFYYCTGKGIFAQA